MLTKNNIMIDLETMGQTSNAAIVAIGAVQFNADTISKKFYMTIDLQSCLDNGLSIDASTIKWWLKQSDEARAELTQDKPDKRLIDALIHFTNWLEDSGENPVIWGNGSDFDNTILTNAYLKCGLPMPWKYYNNRCYRTVKNMAPEIKIKRTGTYHNALDDAISQASHLIRILTTRKMAA